MVAALYARDPDMIRVSARHLRRLLGRTLAPRVADDIVQEIMSRPEGDAPIVVDDEARTLARMDLERKRRRA